MRDVQKKAMHRFAGDTAHHQLEIVLDEGLHRHLRFRRPGTGCYGFDIVTWPGYLAISGDMGSAVFSRLHDMFEFFRPTPSDQGRLAPGELYVNLPYWAEKCQANDGAPKQFSCELFERTLRARFDAYMDGKDLDAIPRGPELANDLWAEIESEVCGADHAYDALARAEAFAPESWHEHAKVFGDFRFHDFWEAAPALEEYTLRFVWRLYAIAHAVRAYDAAKAAVRGDAALTPWSPTA